MRTRMLGLGLATAIAAIGAAPAAHALPVSGYTIWGAVGTSAGGGFSGDGGPATDAQFNNVFQMAAGPDGSLYLADSGNKRIRRVAPDGTITTVAGGGTADPGDGGQATSADISTVLGIVVDGAGTIVFSADNRVRRITPGGVLSTVAGGVAAGASGDGGPATAALLNSPRGLAVDAAGSLFIADAGNSRVRRVAPDGTITTVVGGGPNNPGDGGPAAQATLSFPFDLEFDRAGRLLIGDVVGERIRRVDTSNIITTVAGTGVGGVAPENSIAASQPVAGPEQLAVASNGDIVFAEFNSSRVRRIAAATGRITTIAGGGTTPGGLGGSATDAQLQDPSGLVRDAQGAIYVSDVGLDAVRVLLGPQGGPAGPAGPSGTSGPAGARGEAGPPSKLVVAAFASKVSRARVTVRYVSTASATVRLTIRRGKGRVVTVASATAKPGINTISWNRRLAGRPAAAGAYTAAIVATAGSASVTSRLKVALR